MTDSFKGLMGVAGLSLQDRANARLETAKRQFQGKNSQATKLNSFKENSALKPDPQKKIEDAATQFEALLVHQMIKSMWRTVPKDGILSGGHEEEMYQDMFQEALSNNISSGRGMGIKQVLIEEFKKHEK